MTALDQFGHLSIEEGQQQGADMRTVHIGIGHDNHPVITQLVGVVFLAADAAAQGGDQRRDLGR